MVVAIALGYAARRPREVPLEAWPGDMRIVLRLLGGPASAAVGTPDRG